MKKWWKWLAIMIVIRGKWWINFLSGVHLKLVVFLFSFPTFFFNPVFFSFLPFFTSFFLLFPLLFFFAGYIVIVFFFIYYYLQPPPWRCRRSYEEPKRGDRTPLWWWSTGKAWNWRTKSWRSSGSLRRKGWRAKRWKRFALILFIRSLSLALTECSFIAKVLGGLGNRADFTLSSRHVYMSSTVCQDRYFRFDQMSNLFKMRFFSSPFFFFCERK